MVSMPNRNMARPPSRRNTWNISIALSSLPVSYTHLDVYKRQVMDYFEIFMQRMILCRKAAERLGLQFKLMRCV